jgi:hypothetical protein
MANDIVSTIAEGLDESVGGAGWGANHQVASDFANASPLLLAACRAALDRLPAGTSAHDLCLLAIAAADRSETAPAITNRLDELKTLVVETVSADAAELKQNGKHPDWLKARTMHGLRALDYLASLR